jgi:hypothetical protein
MKEVYIQLYIQSTEYRSVKPLSSAAGRITRGVPDDTDRDLGGGPAGERRDEGFQRIVRGLDPKHRIEQSESAAKKAGIAAWRGTL